MERVCDSSSENNCSNETDGNSTDDTSDTGSYWAILQELTKLREQYNAQQAELAGARITIRETSHQTHKLVAENFTLMGKNAELTEKNAKLLRELEAERRKYDSLQTTTELHKSSSENAADKKTFEEDLNVSRSEQAALQARVAELEQSHEKLRCESETLEEASGTLLGHFNNIARQNDALKAEMESQKKATVAAKQDIASIQAEKDAATATAQDRIALLEKTLVETHEIARRSIETISNQLLSEIEKSRRLSQELEAAQASQIAASSTKAAEVEEMRKEITRLTEDLEAEERVKEHFATKAHDAENQCAFIEAKHARLLFACADKTPLTYNTQEAINLKDRACKALREEVQEKCDLIAKVKKEAQEAIQKRAMTITGLQREVAMLRETCEVHQSRVAIYDKKFPELLAALVEENDLKIEDLIRRHIDPFVMDNAFLRQQFDEIAESKAKEVLAMKLQLDDVVLQVQRLESTIKDRDNDLVKAEADQTRSHMLLDLRDQEKERDGTHIQVLERDCEDLRECLRAMTSTSADARIRTLTSQSEAQIDRLKREVDFLKAELRPLQETEHARQAVGAEDWHKDWIYRTQIESLEQRLRQANEELERRGRVRAPMPIPETVRAALGPAVGGSDASQNLDLRERQEELVDCVRECQEVVNRQSQRQ